MTCRWVTIAALVLAAGAPSHAQEMRAFRAIPTPPPAAPVARDAGAAIEPVSREVVEAAARVLVESWNRPRLRSLMSENFYDLTRLTDELALRVPRDAVLRVLAVQGTTTLAQSTEPVASDPTRVRRRSTVSVLLRTQVEFNDPVQGFQRLEGLNECVFAITEDRPL